MNKKKTERTSIIRDSMDGGTGSKGITSRKGHGWFTGFMPGAPIKFTNAAKNRPKVAKDKHLNLVSNHALYTDESETQLGVTQSQQHRTGRGPDINGQVFNLGSSINTNPGGKDNGVLIDRLHTQQNQQNDGHAAGLFDNTTTEEMPEGATYHTKSIEHNS